MVDRSEPGLVAPLTRDRPTETLGAQQKAPSAQCHWRRPLDQPPPDGRCVYCNQQMNSRGVVQPTVEHVLTFRLLLERRPGQDLCLGPALDAVWNLVLSCEPCDQGEAGTTSSNVVDALARQSRQRPHRGTPPSSSDARGPAWSDTGTQPQPERPPGRGLSRLLLEPAEQHPAAGLLHPVHALSVMWWTTLPSGPVTDFSQ